VFEVCILKRRVADGVEVRTEVDGTSKLTKSPKSDRVSLTYRTTRQLYISEPSTQSCQQQRDLLTPTALFRTSPERVRRSSISHSKVVTIHFTLERQLQETFGQ
jgi:hypothetical protein